jgi:hypothetical protein
MLQLFKSSTIGALSGAITYIASIYTLGYTNAIAMPHGFSLYLWNAVVVFGLGASLVALVFHLVALRIFSATALPAFLSFVAAVALALVVSGQLSTELKAFAAWLAGAGLAALIHWWLRPNNSFKWKPLRGST